MFLSQKITPYGGSKCMFTDKDSQIVSKAFAMVFTVLKIKHLKLTAYRFYTNKRIGLGSESAEILLRKFVLKQQTNWKVFVQLLAHAHNTRLQQSTNTTPYNLRISKHPPRPTVHSQGRTDIVNVSRKTSVRSTI